jgi:hypothetical protein
LYQAVGALEGESHELPRLALQPQSKQQTVKQLPKQTSSQTGHQVV